MAYIWIDFLMLSAFNLLETEHANLILYLVVSEGGV